MIPRNALEAARVFLAPVLGNASCVVDATAGNGHDVLFLCEQTPADCRVWAFDIQPAAVLSTAGLLRSRGYLDKVRLIQEDHAMLRTHVREPVDAAVFNLGYLPGHDHTVTTRPESLGQALETLLELLSPDGRIAIVAYPGHSPGQAEVEYLETYLSGRPQERYTVTRLDFINQRNRPAILYSIGKMRRKPHEVTSSVKG